MRRTIVAVVAAVFVVISATAAGGTWYVDGSVSKSGNGRSWETAFKTVQQGINAASGGETVLVAKGIYVENIRFKGKNIVLTSTDPLEPSIVESTIIDGDQAGPVVTFDGTEDETCILKGFTLQNGKAHAGGGVRGTGGHAKTHATIRNNIIRLNSAVQGGGISHCDGIIEENTVVENSAQRYGGGLAYCHGIVRGNTIARNAVNEDGGGLAYCHGTIQNNTISGNESNRGGGLAHCHGIIQDNTVAGNWAIDEGGGLAFCDGTIENNIITENTADTDEGGGLAYCDGTIQNNTVSGNSADYGGGFSDCDGTIQGNVISGNFASFGGGLSGCDGAVQNNMVAGNSASRDAGGLHYCHGTIQRNVISGNSAKRYGGGLATCWAIIHDNLIVGNLSSGYGGGLDTCRGPIHNNTICGNSAVVGGGGMHSCRGTIINCIIRGNSAPAGPQLELCSEPTYSCVENWAGSGERNITDDPRFVDSAAGDYRLGPDSPCIDSGANYHWFVWPQLDLDGNCRLAGNYVDMGCYECYSSADSDGDLLSDADETAAGTNPLNEDTDGDGLRDGLEVLRGADPLWPTPPRTVRVPEQVPTIQAALLCAVNGEEIAVAAGTYRENLHFCGTDVILRSCDPRDPEVVRSTILDGGGAGPTVSFNGSESEACVLSGFTISGGLAERGGGILGGLTGKSTRATIQDNVITGNSARYGGGLYSCDGTIQRNIVSANSGQRYGGGLYSCNGTVFDNMIAGNSTGGNGGGLFGCNGTIQSNVIADNIAEGTYVWQDKLHGEGGGLASCLGAVHNNAVTGNSAARHGGGFAFCDGPIQNNVIAGNRANLAGGGLYRCNGPVQNNTVVGNKTDGDGAALCDCDGLIQNNTIADNTAQNAGTIAYCDGRIQNCIVWGNAVMAEDQLYMSTEPTYCCIGGWTGSGEGNVTEDPRFVDPDGKDDNPETYQDNDYRLSAGSPCIDAGKNEDWMMRAVDLDGNPRILYGTSFPTVDMGAYEFVSEGPIGKTWHVDGSVLSSGDGRSWKTAMKTVQEGIDAASEGGTVIVAPGTYVENIRFTGENITLRSTNPLDSNVVSSTIIDGNRAGPVVTFSGTEDETCILSGFTIRNGRAECGGGICGGTPDAHTHATIDSNVIVFNFGDSAGGLAFCDGLIRRNAIRENSATSQYGEGGGLAFCHGTIEDNAIAGNSCVWRGGGLARCHGTVVNNSISLNSASSGGGLAYCEGSVLGNIISGNSAKVWGGGLHSCSGIIRNNIVSGNSANWGGGMALCEAAIQNDTVVRNSAGNAGGGLAWCRGTVENCIIWENSAPSYAQIYESPLITYSCIEGWAGGGEGNIAPPRAGFADEVYHLLPDSPCIDAGKNEEWMPNAVDLDRNPRIFYGASSRTVDMGAYEYGSFAFRILQVSEVDDGKARLIWKSRPGDTYVIWSCLDSLTGLWSEEATMPSQGISTTWTDPMSPFRKFYVIELR